MGHNSVVSGYSKIIGIPWVNGLSMRPWDLGRHTLSVNATTLLLSSKAPLLCG